MEVRSIALGENFKIVCPKCALLRAFGLQFTAFVTLRVHVNKIKLNYNTVLILKKRGFPSQKSGNRTLLPWFRRLCTADSVWKSVSVRT